MKRVWIFQWFKRREVGSHRGAEKVGLLGQSGRLSSQGKQPAGNAMQAMK